MRIKLSVASFRSVSLPCAARDRLLAGRTDRDDANTSRAREESVRRLADGLARLEAIAEWLEGLDPAAGDPSGLTAHFEAVRVIHDVVDALLETELAVWGL